MQNDEFLGTDACCSYYQVEKSFLIDLQDYGLLELVEVNKQQMIHLDQIPRLEKFIHLYYDLNINLAGIDAITHLLDKVQGFQHEITLLRNQLKRYE